MTQSPYKRCLDGNTSPVTSILGGQTMKKYLLLTLTLVLTAALFTACGCTSQNANYTTAPATMPYTKFHSQKLAALNL